MIIYEDQEIIVCHKPAGVPVQSASVRTKDLVSILRNHTGGEIYVVHRLDQPVEGVLVFAKTRAAAADLSRQVSDGSMKKVYRAVCEPALGVELAEKTWYALEDYLVKDGRNNCSRVAKKGERDAKRAYLRFCVEERFENGTVAVTVELGTGRHHQIRVQMAHAKLPLCGDRKYNAGGRSDVTNLQLCAVSVSFTHPKTKKKETFCTSPS